MKNMIIVIEVFVQSSVCVCVFSSLSLGSLNKGKTPVFSTLFWMHFEVMPLPLDCDENVHFRILMVGFSSISLDCISNYHVGFIRYTVL